MGGSLRLQCGSRPAPDQGGGLRSFREKWVVRGMAKLLEVKNLVTEFSTQDGVVRAVDGISYDLNEGEIIGIVGESGCGKTVSALSVMRLVASPPGKIVGGEVLFEGQDLLRLSGSQMRRVRGNRISMIFQEPMTSLNPVLTIGRQLTGRCSSTSR